MRLVHPFLIDTWPEAERMAFVLGYEMGVIRTKVAAGEAFDLTVHAENEDRMRVLLGRAACSYEAGPDAEGWVRFNVEAKG